LNIYGQDNNIEMDQKHPNENVMQTTPVHNPEENVRFDTTVTGAYESGHSWKLYYDFFQEM